MNKDEDIEEIKKIFTHIVRMLCFLGFGYTFRYYAETTKSEIVAGIAPIFALACGFLALFEFLKAYGKDVLKLFEYIKNICKKGKK